MGKTPAWLYNFPGRHPQGPGDRFGHCGQCGTVYGVDTVSAAGTAAFRGVDSIFPWAETSLRIIGVLPTTVIGFALVLSWFRYLQRWALLSKVIGAGLIFLYAGASAKAGVAVPNLGGLLAVATIAGLSWLIFAYTAFRRNSAALPTTIGVLTLLSLIKLVVQNPFPMAIPSAVLGIIVTIAMVLFLTGFQEVENQCY